MKILKSHLLLAAALLVFAACERNDMELDQAETTPALGEAETNAVYDDLDALTAEAVATAEAEGERVLTSTASIPACAVITRNPDTRTITLDFGTGCTDGQGNVRTGKVIISRSGRYFESGSTTITTLENYTINSLQVEGTRTVTNVTASSTGQPQFSVSLSGGRVSWPDGTFAEREVDHLRSWVRAANPLNDEWHISGSASGSNRQGQEYTSTITQDLVIKLSCLSEGVYVPVQGSQLINRPDKPAISLQWGSGSCDREVTVSMNGRSRTITIGR